MKITLKKLIVIINYKKNTDVCNLYNFYKNKNVFNNYNFIYIIITNN